MAITGDSTVIKNQDLGIGVKTYNEAIGDYQGDVVGNYYEYESRYAQNTKQSVARQMYEDETVAGKYVLKGKAGITANFYQAFSNAFDEYKSIIENDLKELNSDPNVRQAFRGTDIEKAIKNLLKAVEIEAKDYLFKLERDEKTVINGVKDAFRKQQESMGSSMQQDTSKLATSNSSSGDVTEFNVQAKGWYDAENKNSSSSGGGVKDILSAGRPDSISTNHMY